MSNELKQFEIGKTKLGTVKVREKDKNGVEKIYSYDLYYGNAIVTPGEKNFVHSKHLDVDDYRKRLNDFLNTYEGSQYAEPTEEQILNDQIELYNRIADEKNQADSSKQAEPEPQPEVVSTPMTAPPEPPTASTASHAPVSQDSSSLFNNTNNSVPNSQANDLSQLEAQKKQLEDTIELQRRQLEQERLNYQQQLEQQRRSSMQQSNTNQWGATGQAPSNYAQPARNVPNQDDEIDEDNIQDEEDEAAASNSAFQENTKGFKTILLVLMTLTFLASGASLYLSYMNSQNISKQVSDALNNNKSGSSESDGTSVLTIDGQQYTIESTDADLPSGETKMTIYGISSTEQNGKVVNKVIPLGKLNLKDIEISDSGSSSTSDANTSSDASESTADSEGQSSENHEATQ